MATPFVQGQLRQEHLTVSVDTACAHCGKGLHLTIDSDLNCNVKEAGARPLLFEPDIDWQHFSKPNIIGDY